MTLSNIKFAIFGSTYQKDKAASLAKVLQKLKEHSAIISIEKGFYDAICQNVPFSFTPDEIITNHNFAAQFAISIGGDGTFLKCAEFVGNKEIPIIGINTGRLGFLADTTPDDFEDILQNIAQGVYDVEKRSVLSVSTSNSMLNVYPNALNEVAVLKHDNSSMITIETSVDGNYLNTYQSDGIIICTPTGSTGYSLSVGGPIISPISQSIAITAVAPHSLNIRPIVLNNNCTITLKINSRNHNFLLSIDGRSQSLSDEILLTIKKADYPILVVRSKNKNYFETLRNKLMWGADTRL